jgi:hypothetical protein
VHGRAERPRTLLDDDALVAVVSLIAGLAAAAGRAAPTGHPLTDAVLTGVGTALIVLVGALAPWWVAVVVAATAGAVALQPALVLLAVVALAAGLWAGAVKRPARVLVAASLALSFNVLGRAELGGPIGAAAVVSALAVVLVFVTGIRRRSKVTRRLAWGGAALGALFVAGASVGFAYEAASSRHELASGLNTAELGVVALENGRFDEAADWFRQAQGYLASANQNLDQPWARAAAVVPVVARYQSAVSDMSHVGADGAGVVADALGQIDLDRLRPVNGKFDLAALADLSAPLGRVRDSLLRLQDTADEARSDWLAQRATYELDDFDASVGEHLPGLENALQAIQLAPKMLGADGPRTYLLLFTTPSESRSLGGFVGSYAELTVDDGQLSLGSFGRSQDLDAAALAAGAKIHGHADFVEEFGNSYGYDTDGQGSVGDAAFRNLTATANYPWVGEIAADLYAQTTGRHVDGVITMDPYVVATLLGYTGPVHLASLGQDVAPQDAAQFLLRDQYVVGAAENDVRADSLAEASALAFQGLLSGKLPEPIQLARDLAPLTGARRLLLWSAQPDEQALLETVGISGRLPVLDGADGWSFAVTNLAGNKIDSFLQRKASYSATTDPRTGVTTGTMHIELTNTAPADGLPRYVIGNLVGKPNGTSSLVVSLYSPLGLDGVSVGGTAVGVAPGNEDGWRTYRFPVDIPPGATVTIDATLSGTVAHPDQVVTWTQPLASDLQPG